MQRNSRSKAPELLTDMLAHITSALVDLADMPADQAARLGQEITDRMASHWGGQNIYFPMGLSARLSERDRKIFEEFDGSNHSDLARKHKVSLQWVYKIIKQVRQEQLRERQGALFNGDSSPG